MSALVLIAEDEVEIAEILDAYLVREGFRTVRAANGQTALDLHAALKPDLVLLDVRMPRLDGWAVLSELRRRGHTPVIMITALDQDIDKLQALRVGADDYVVKPFNPVEVVARAHAVLRRSVAASDAKMLRVGPIEIDLESYVVRCIGSGEGMTQDARLALTLTEFRILAYMARFPMRVFSRGELTDACLKGQDVLERTVDSHLSKLRRKLEAAGVGQVLQGVRGVGYRLEPGGVKGLAGLTGLGRKIALRMSLVTLAVLAISALGTFALYSWVFENFPEAVASPSAWKPQPIDYAAFAASGVIALLVAVVAGGQLARRIVIPLTSLAETARRIAEGDLSARAAAGDRSLGETADLVDDFNAMAGRLESLAESMTLWNASIAHELRTPVTILRGRLQGAADGVFAMEPAMIASLLKQVEGLGRLIEDLRVVSLADGGRLPLQPQRIDLAEVIGDLRGAVEPGLIEQGFEVEWRLATAEAVGDPMRLQQAALALIENARRHAGPGLLIIATGAHEDGVRLSVEDSGPGLSEAFEPFAFDPFRRASGDGEGSGLGLAVVRVIAETHGGRAAYRAGARGGSVFEIILPLNGVE